MFFFLLDLIIIFNSKNIYCHKRIQKKMIIRLIIIMLKSQNWNLIVALLRKLKCFGLARNFHSWARLELENSSWNSSLKYGSEEKGSLLCKCSILLGFFMSKKLERLRSELLSEDKITNLFGFFTRQNPGGYSIYRVKNPSPQIRI